MTSRKWMPGVFALWLAVISYRYINSVVQGFRSPFNLGTDIEWLAAWLGIAILMMILAVTMDRAVEVVYCVLAAACMLVFILSGTYLAAIAVLGILMVAHFAGRALFRIFGAGTNEIALTIPLGLTLSAVGGFVLAAFHLLALPAILLMLGLLSFGGLRGALLRPLSIGRDLRLPMLLIAPVIFLNLTWAVVPEIQFDANNYHLAVSQTYLQNHGFIDLPYSFHSYFYRLIDMLFTIAMAIQGPAAAKLLSFAFGLIAAVTVFSLSRLVFDQQTAAWAAALFYTTPVVSWLSGTADTDNAVAMLVGSAFVAFVKWRRSNGQPIWIYAASILAGAAFAAKLNSVFALPVLFAVALWSLRRYTKTLTVCGILALAVVLPWYALTYHWTGNPVFPLLNGIFRSSQWDLNNSLMDAKAYGIGISPGRVLRLPFSLTWNTIRFGAATPRGAAGIALLLVIPFGIALVARIRHAAVLVAASVVYILLWALTFQNVRYYVHMLPVFCMLGAATVFHFSTTKWYSTINRICLTSVLVFQFPATSMMFWNIPDRFPLTAALNMESRDAFLKRSLRGYAAVEHLNALLQPGQRVVGVDVEDLRLYLNAPLETLSDSTLISFLRTAGEEKDQRLLGALRKSGFAYILTTRDALKDPPAYYPYIRPEFLRGFAVLVFSDGNTAVYRLNS